MSVATHLKDMPPMLAAMQEGKTRLRPAAMKLTPQQYQTGLLSTTWPWYNKIEQELRDLWKFLFVRIDFSKDLDGNPIPPGTQLDVAGNPYESLGVHFSAKPGALWMEVHEQDQLPSPHVVAAGGAVELDWACPGPLNDFWSGSVQVDFETPHSVVEIAVVASPYGFANQPYDGAQWWMPYFSGTTFPADQMPPKLGECSPLVTLVDSSDSSSISSVVFGSQGERYSGCFGSFTDLVFSRFW